MQRAVACSRCPLLVFFDQEGRQRPGNHAVQQCAADRRQEAIDRFLKVTILYAHAPAAWAGLEAARLLEAEVEFRIAADGTISTVAGTGKKGFGGDGGLATAAQLSSPHSIALDKDDNLYIADIGNNNARQVDLVLYRAPVPSPGDAATAPAEAVRGPKRGN